MLLQLGLSTSGFGHPVTIQISAAYIIQLTEHTFIVAVFEVAAVLRFFVITVTDTTIKDNHCGKKYDKNIYGTS